jgi:UDP-2-acetamido-3-amino-2,3-dideoxy-glucuronate N-acetyltransferase
VGAAEFVMRSVERLPLKRIAGGRGLLTAGQFGDELPFMPARFFILEGVCSGVTKRGAHAHKACSQILLAASGATIATCFDGTCERDFVLRAGDAHALLVSPMIWLDVELIEASRLLVLASELYDESDYIRDRQEFMRAVAE